MMIGCWCLVEDMTFIINNSNVIVRRGDPNTGARPPTTDNWPRNGGLYTFLLQWVSSSLSLIALSALLKGTGPYLIKGEDWFKVSEIQQAGTTGFKPVPDGTS